MANNPDLHFRKLQHHLINRCVVVLYYNDPKNVLMENENQSLQFQWENISCQTHGVRSEEVGPANKGMKQINREQAT